MKKIRLVIFLLTLLFSNLVSGIDHNIPAYFHKKISNITFLTAQIDKGNIESLLSNGVTAFMLDGKNVPNILDRIIPEIKNYLTSHPNTIIFIFIKENISKNIISKKINQYYIDEFLYPGDSAIFNTSYADIIKTNKRLILFTDNQSNQNLSFKNNIYVTNFHLIKNNKNSLFNDNRENLICYDPVGDNNLFLNKDSLMSQSFYIWTKKASFPNFLMLTPGLIQDFIPVIDSLNRSIHYTGIVKSEDKTLKNLHWKFNKSYSESNGIFSFPHLKMDYGLYIPWKEGYKFYPEVIKFDINTQHYDISAIRLKLEEQMIYHFKFDKEALNEADKKGEAQLFEMQFKNEPKRGKVAHFNNKNAGIQLNNLYQFSSSRPFTILAWVKPTNTKRIQTILSKGEVFSAKIRFNDLSFAGTTFNSKISSSYKIKSNIWQQITYVYVPDYHIQFFINGQLIFEDEIRQIPDNDQSLTIGNNFSNEYFQGEMDDLKVWTRALSKEEIEQLYYLRPDNFNIFNLFYVFIPIIMIFIIQLIRKRKKKTNSLTAKLEIAEADVLNEKEIKKICLFGHFSIINETGENLTKHFSPKVKQLFLLLLINKNGVTIQTINDELWPGSDEEKAKQNRNFNIQQIKKIIINIPGIQLEYKAKHWKLEISEDILVDYFVFDSISKELFANNYTNFKNIPEYISIVERGRFLQGTDAEMFDVIKSKTADTIIEQLLKIADKADNKLKIRLGNILLLQDSLSEEGLKLAVKSLSDSGRKGEANELYHSFVKRYQKIYNEEFSLKFHDLI